MKDLTLRNKTVLKKLEEIQRAENKRAGVILTNKQLMEILIDKYWEFQKLIKGKVN